MRTRLKKIFNYTIFLVMFFLLLLPQQSVEAGGGTSNLDTLYYRFRDDSTALNTDGGWLFAQNTQATDLAKGTTYRLRINISQEGTKKITSSPTIQWGTNSDCSTGTWTNFADAGATTTEHFEMTDSAQFVEDDDTTSNLLTASAGTWINGDGKDATPTAGPLTYDPDEYSENEYSFKATTNATDGGTYYLRVLGNNSWSVCSSLTIEAATGSLTVDIVDSGDTSVASPSVAMSSTTFSWAFQTTTGTFGVASEKIRVDNGTGTATWTLSLAASSPTDSWNDATLYYDFNDPTASAGDGGDTDSYGGQMTVDPSVSTITPQGGCTTTGVTKGSSTGFSEGSTDSITLITAGATADTSCYWDITGIGISQTIPAEQNAGSGYNIDMVLSVVAS